MLRVDINCDMGEGISNDAAIMPFISSANIACGYHAGDEKTMHATVASALWHNVAIGAHPGFNDKNNFGRTEVNVSSQEIYGLVIRQVLLLQDIVASHGAVLHHVKPHGALYNMAAKNMDMALAIAQAVKDVDKALVLYGLYNSCLITAAQQLGLSTAAEVFADRRYNKDGSLIARSIANAVINNEDEAIQQVLQMVQHNTVVAVNGEIITVQPQTVCLHGDSEHAVTFAQKINVMLRANGVMITSI